MPLKNHKNGFSFIEMMMALALLSIFGTSLFLVQTNLFSKLLKTHITVSSALELDKQLLKFSEIMQQALAEKKPLESITLHHENKNPDYAVDIKLKRIDPSSQLFKNFGKNSAFIQATITQDNQTQTWYSLAYTAIPEPEKNEKPNPKSAKEPS